MARRDFELAHEASELVGVLNPVSNTGLHQSRKQTLVHLPVILPTSDRTTAHTKQLRKKPKKSCGFAFCRVACGTCVRRPLKPRSDCIRLCCTIRSVTTGTRWSGPMKSRIVYELLPSRTTEYYGGSGPFRLKILTNKQTNKHSNYSRHVCPSGQAATNVGVRGLSPGKEWSMFTSNT